MVPTELIDPMQDPMIEKIETVFGTVSSNRIGYGNKGVESPHPLDAELNFPPGRYSLELRLV